MAELPIFAPPAATTAVSRDGITLADESAMSKWRSWNDPGVALGRSRRDPRRLVFAVAPGEWMVIGDRLDDGDADLTHVRAQIRVTGTAAGHLLSHVCALDLGDLMTPNGSAARTLLAGVATELVRDDVDELPSYLLLMSRSFAHSVWERLVELTESI